MKGNPYLTAMAGAALALGMVAFDPVAANPGFGRAFQEVQKETCGCGDICKTRISCELPGCAREHGRTAEAAVLQFENEHKAEKPQGFIVKGMKLQPIGMDAR